MRFIKLISLCTLIALYSCNTSQKSPVQPTVFELSNQTQTANYQQTIDYCNFVADNNSKIKHISIGKTPQKRDIPLLIIDSKENFTVHKVRESGNTVLLIQANIHPGEPDGNDAGMLLINKLIKEKRFPKNVTILFLPIVNPDGLARFGPHNRINQNGPSEMGWRTTAQNYNLNRDYVKADALEMRHWLRLYNQWLPDFTIDCHVTDGADYQYVLTYLIETLGNMDSLQTQWQKEYISHIEQKLLVQNIPIFRYVSFQKWHDPRSGLYTRPARPMLTQGYTAIQNRPGLLLEAHALKPFSQRVNSMLALFIETVDYLEKNSKQLIELNLKSDTIAIEMHSKNQTIPLTYSTTDQCDTVDFLGVEYDIVKSDLTGGDWFQYHSDKPTTYRLPFYNKFKGETFAHIPAAYIIGPEWRSIKEGLDKHGIKYSILTEEVELTLNTWQCTNPTWNSAPFEGRFMIKDVDVKETSKKQKWPAYSIVIQTNQRRVRLLTHILNPNSPDSYFRYGFFNSIFEQKEYYESYIMEQRAREMLDTAPNLHLEFEKWKKAQPSELSSYEQLGWFYEQSPFYDYKRYSYPISTLNKEQLSLLLDKLK